jgi:tRNA/rRNA methyltransferase
MRVVFILVEPAVPENVGASARAIKTMSFNELRLVNPCDFRSEGARKLAHGSDDVLSSAKVFDSFRDSIEDIDFIIGTSAKSRRIKVDYYLAAQVCDLISGKGSTIGSVGVVFGREEYGLTNAEAALCDILVTIPMVSRYPSLNLSQAVMIMAYELSGTALKDQGKTDMQPGMLTLKAARNQILDVLTSIGIDHNEVLFNRIIERINVLAEDDLHLLCSVCKYFRESRRQHR